MDWAMMTGVIIWPWWVLAMCRDCIVAGEGKENGNEGMHKMNFNTCMVWILQYLLSHSIIVFIIVSCIRWAGG